MLNLKNINSISELRAIEATLKEKIKFLESEINPRQERIFTCKEIIQLNKNQLNELININNDNIVVSSVYKKEDGYWIKKTKYNIREIGKEEAEKKLIEANESTKEEIEFLEKYILIDGEPLLELNKMIKELNNNHKLLREVQIRINKIIESPNSEKQTTDEIFNKTRNEIFRIAKGVIYKNAGLFSANQDLLSDIAGALTNKCFSRVINQLLADYELNEYQGSMSERFLSMTFVDDSQIKKYLAESSKEDLGLLGLNESQREIIRNIFQPENASQIRPVKTDSESQNLASNESFLNNQKVFKVDETISVLEREIQEINKMIEQMYLNNEKRRKSKITRFVSDLWNNKYMFQDKNKTPYITKIDFCKFVFPKLIHKEKIKTNEKGKFKEIEWSFEQFYSLLKQQ